MNTCFRNTNGEHKLCIQIMKGRLIVPLVSINSFFNTDFAIGYLIPNQEKKVCMSANTDQFLEMYEYIRQNSLSWIFNRGNT